MTTRRGHMLPLLLAGTLLVTACAGTSSTAAPPATPADSQATPLEPPVRDGQRLLARLRAGGMVVVFRHAATNRSAPDAERVDLEDCSTQRNLSEQGRADARVIGESFRALRIPVGQVLASPYCRTRHTAELAFGRAETLPGLERLWPEADETVERRLNQTIRDRAPLPGEGNLAIVTHGRYPNVLEPASLAEGEAAVYAVEGEEFVLLGQVTPEQWADLGT